MAVYDTAIAEFSTYVINSNNLEIVLNDLSSIENSFDDLISTYDSTVVSELLNLNLHELYHLYSNDFDNSNNQAISWISVIHTNETNLQGFYEYFDPSSDEYSEIYDYYSVVHSNLSDFNERYSNLNSNLVKSLDQSSNYIGVENYFQKANIDFENYSYNSNMFSSNIIKLYTLSNSLESLTYIELDRELIYFNINLIRSDLSDIFLNFDLIYENYNIYVIELSNYSTSFQTNVYNVVNDNFSVINNGVEKIESVLNDAIHNIFEAIYLNLFNKDRELLQNHLQENTEENTENSFSDDYHYTLTKPNIIANIQLTKVDDTVLITFDEITNVQIMTYELFYLDTLISRNIEPFFELFITPEIFTTFTISARNYFYSAIVSDPISFIIEQPITPTMFSIQYVSSEKFMFSWQSIHQDTNREYIIYRAENYSSVYTTFINNIPSKTTFIEVNIPISEIFANYYITENIISYGFESDFSDPIVLLPPQKATNVVINYMNATENEEGEYIISWNSENLSELYKYDIFYEYDNTPSTRVQINSLSIQDKTYKLTNESFTGSWYIVEKIFSESQISDPYLIAEKRLTIKTIDAQQNPKYRINFNFTYKDEPDQDADIGEYEITLQKVSTSETDILTPRNVSAIYNRIYKYFEIYFPDAQAFDAVDVPEIVVNVKIKLYDVSRLSYDIKYVKVPHILTSSTVINDNELYQSSLHTGSFLLYPTDSRVFKFSGVFNRYILDQEIYLNPSTGAETLIFAFNNNTEKNTEIPIIQLGDINTRFLKIAIIGKTLQVYGNFNFTKSVSEYTIYTSKWYYVVIINKFTQTSMYIYNEISYELIFEETNENQGFFYNGETKIYIGIDDSQNSFNGRVTDIVYYSRELDYAEIIRAISPFNQDPWWFRQISLTNRNDFVQSKYFDILEKSNHFYLRTTINENETVSLTVKKTSENIPFLYSLFLNGVRIAQDYKLVLLNNSYPTYSDYDISIILQKNEDTYLNYNTNIDSFQEYEINILKTQSIAIQKFYIYFTIADQFDIFDLSINYNTQFFITNNDKILKYDKRLSSFIFSNTNDANQVVVKLSFYHIEELFNAQSDNIYKTSFDISGIISPSEGLYDYQKTLIVLENNFLPYLKDYFVFLSVQDSQQNSVGSFDIQVLYSSYDGTMTGIHLKNIETNRYWYVPNETSELKSTSTFIPNDKRFIFKVVYDYQQFNFNNEVFYNIPIELKADNFDQKTGIYVQKPLELNPIITSNKNLSLDTNKQFNIIFALKLNDDSLSSTNTILSVDQLFLEVDIHKNLFVRTYENVFKLQVDRWYYIVFIINENEVKIFIFSFVDGLTKFLHKKSTHSYIYSQTSYSFVNNLSFDISNIFYIKDTILENRHVLKMFLIKNVDPWWERLTSNSSSDSYFYDLLNNNKINSNSKFELKLNGTSLSVLQMEKSINIPVNNNTLSSLLVLDGFENIYFEMLTNNNYIVIKQVGAEKYLVLNEIAEFELYDLYLFESGFASISLFDVFYSVFELTEQELFKWDGTLRLEGEVILLSTIYKQISTTHSLALFDVDDDYGLINRNTIVDATDNISTLFLNFQRQEVKNAENNIINIWNFTTTKDINFYKYGGYGVITILGKNELGGHIGSGSGTCLSVNELTNYITETDIGNENAITNIFKLKPSSTKGCIEIIFDDYTDIVYHISKTVNKTLIISNTLPPIKFRVKLIDTQGNGDYVYEIKDDVFSGEAVLDRSEMIESYLVAKSVDAFLISSPSELKLETNRQIQLNTPNLLINGIPINNFIKHLFDNETDYLLKPRYLHELNTTLKNLTSDELNNSYNMTEMYNSAPDSNVYYSSNIYTSNITSDFSHVNSNKISIFDQNIDNVMSHIVSDSNCYYHGITLSAQKIYFQNTTDIENIEFNISDDNKSVLRTYISNIIGDAIMPSVENQFIYDQNVEVQEQTIQTTQTDTLIDWWNQPIPKELISDKLNVSGGKLLTHYTWKVLVNSRIVGASYTKEPINEKYTIDYYKLKCIQLGDTCLGFCLNKFENYVQMMDNISEIIENKIYFNTYIKIKNKL
jgi:hypothetical protein